MSQADQIAAGTPGGGALDGSNASRIAEFGTASGGPDEMWGALWPGWEQPCVTRRLCL
ncbi:hypothetical protein [Nesterenkonia pannonica]|uniref:hypothetical protein n=1 Tax=Nesterenkonia pannonica TaxID=1548602 RepID=UPI0021649253|nr:hypothetical protein [Nesterenkonia pannonica]